MKIGFLNCVISFISVVLREPTLNISVLTNEHVSMESGLVKVVSHSTMEISEITRIKIQI